MATRIGGQRRKTRFKLQKGYRQKGKISLSKYFQKLEMGQRVLFKAESAVQGGMYHPRFHGKVATVVGKQGACYMVKFKDHKKEKQMIVHPIHLRKVE